SYCASGAGCILDTVWLLEAPTIRLAHLCADSPLVAAGRVDYREVVDRLQISIGQRQSSRLIFYVSCEITWSPEICATAAAGWRAKCRRQFMIPESTA